MMDEYITIKCDGSMPIVASAIHSGHLISEHLLPLLSLNKSDQLREEDPYTEIWTDISDNRIIAHHSRFELDLNRPPEKAIYRIPSDSWGLRVWATTPSQRVLTGSLQKYKYIYERIQECLTGLLARFGVLVVYDLHSYNHRRGGPDATPEDAIFNPEINVGTGTMDRDYWAPLVDRFINDLRNFNFQGRHLDVRENVKFKGGHFPKWIHEKFAGSVCCLSIEVKKFFMDEWTGEPDHMLIGGIGDGLRSTLPGVLEELLRYK